MAVAATGAASHSLLLKEKFRNQTILNTEVITNYSKFTFNINQCHLMAHQLPWHNGLGVEWDGRGHDKMRAGS